ncbi:lysophospholipase L1-like esterase [Wenyingzhuangia heitensis]|uniref:Lysophospholipase L1-like esterase n=1 Tax=Wenyingzhuangia heitensis TaxID=1487859 RepID=A0ABX0U5A6_9FLAO|nr:SGNH/GDSL hydrolase family protein [Wenyingzhuangia heitensis]NIJ43943.1 lysophospholipase L1-like esterase [Wenyingzhuangia heitensis]
MRKYIYFLAIGCSLCLFGCDKESNEIDVLIENPIEPESPIDIEENSDFIYKLLSLGDSYTIGESVCTTCRFPEQLKSKIEENSNATVNLKIIARTGWTTTDLKSNINLSLATDYDFVTLLIGVNNQFQGIDFEVYKQEFPELVHIAIKAAKGNINNLVVVSIPDYAFTPFGGGDVTITKEIEKYNQFAKAYCLNNNIEFLNITDITQQGFSQPSLVASDGLHPSELAYQKVIERLYPLFLQKVTN